MSAAEHKCTYMGARQPDKYSKLVTDRTDNTTVYPSEQSDQFHVETVCTEHQYFNVQ